MCYCCLLHCLLSRLAITGKRWRAPSSCFRPSFSTVSSPDWPSWGRGGGRRQAVVTFLLYCLLSRLAITGKRWRAPSSCFRPSFSTVSSPDWPSRGRGGGRRQAVCFWVADCPNMHSAPHGRINPDNLTCCHTETEAAVSYQRLTSSQPVRLSQGDQKLQISHYLIYSRDSDTGPASPSTDTITAGACQGGHWIGKRRN